MNANESFGALGVLLKEESLQTVEHYVVLNTLVLESFAPFPGYHGQIPPQDTKPDSLFLITDRTYPMEEIYRISQNICSYQKVHPDACPADIFIHNSNLPCIRIKGLHNYSLISELQGCYIDKGIHFMKKKLINAPGLIRITKVFSVEKMENHLFKDCEDDSTFYLSIPYHFNWNLFKKVTMNVKNNMDNSNFDCALGFIYQKKLLEFIRIYTHHPDLQRLRNIREKYLEEIKRILEDAV